MANIKLPQVRSSGAPQIKKREVPVQQILQVLGHNPIGQALTDLGPVLSQALAKREEIRRQAKQVAAIGTSTGVNLEGVDDPAIAASIAKGVADNRSEEMRAREAIAARAESARFAAESRQQAAQQGNDLKMMMLQNNKANSEANRAIREDQFKDRQVNSYSSTLEKTNIPNALAVGQRVLTMLPERGNDVPGFGPLESNIPNFMASDNMRTMRAAVSQLFNIELKDRSGTAVTDNELERLKNEFGQGKMASEEQLRNGIRQYLQRVSEIGQNVDSGFAPEIRSEYESRGGRNFKNSLQGLTNTPKIMPLSPIAQQGQGLSPEKQRRLEELRRKRQGG